MGRASRVFKGSKKEKGRGTITFFKEDMASVQSPHSDAVIVTLNINDYDVRCVLIDSGSIVDVLYFSTFSRMNLIMDCLAKYGSLVEGFSDESVLVGVINLFVKTST